MREEGYIRGLFSYYYEKNPIHVDEVGKREFGFGGWDKKIESRHMHFSTDTELMRALKNERPLYVSRSAAYYEFPDARPMERKGWLGCDLIFDLDAEHHACGKFTCPPCLQKVKDETIKLIEDFLMPDFGVSRNDINIVFSGSRGYHVHVFDRAYRKLWKDERREIADYAGGTGISYEHFFGKRGKLFSGPAPSEGGYGGKFAREVIKRLENEEFASYLSTKLKKKENRDMFIRGIEKGDWERVHIAKKDEKFAKLFNEIVGGLSCDIDVNVTADISKLIRLPFSLHGGTGMIAAPVKDIDKFDPMADAIVFSDRPVSIRMNEDAPKIIMKGVDYGPYKKEGTAEVPEHLAVYLICKKAAVLE